MIFSHRYVTKLSVKERREIFNFIKFRKKQNWKKSGTVWNRGSSKSFGYRQSYE